jgi:predicted polyphosphate/ATP-dependent NAD kinase
MKKTVATVAFALTAIMTFSVATGSRKLGLFGVDVVSAATDAVSGATGTTETTTPAKSTATTPTTTQTAIQTATEVNRFLAFGSYGGDVKLVQEWLNNNGYNLKADGIFGKQTEAAVKSYQSKNGLVVDGVVGPKTLSKLTPPKTVEAAPVTPAVVTAEKTVLKIGRADYAAHGTKCFTSAVVAMVGDKIVAASIDDYQVMAKDTSIGVPNSDKDFGTYFKDPTRVLGSKRTNSVAYSKNMAASGATIAIDKNLDAIQTYVKGKTVAELEAKLLASSPEQMVDAVSSATLVDTKGYVSAVVAAAKAAKENSSIQVDVAALSTLKVGRVDYAAHGTKCFTSAVVVMAGDKVVGTSLDDYQFMAKDTSTGVPNSDKDFGTYYKDPTRVLGSKRVNTAAYSKNMAASGATIDIDKNLDAVQAFAAGKTVSELEEMLKVNSKDPLVDAVSSATLVDTNGYLSAIVAAAKAVK